MGVVSCILFVFAGFIQNTPLCLGVSVILLFGSVLIMKKLDDRKYALKNSASN